VEKVPQLRAFAGQYQHAKEQSDAMLRQSKEEIYNNIQEWIKKDPKVGTMSPEIIQSVAKEILNQLIPEEYDYSYQ